MTHDDAPGAPRLAVTGTDTGVGKTVVTCALLAACRARGWRVPGMKPVETGIADRDAAVGAAGDAVSDAARIRAAAGDVDDPRLVSPQTFAEPLAPMVAAARAGRVVDVTRIDDAFGLLTRGADGVIVEGAGGLLVPFTKELTLADLAVRWALDVVVVAANRLGVLNHVLLTVGEAQRRGLRVLGVVLNDATPDAADVARATNAGALRELLPAMPVIELPHARDVRSPASLAAVGERVLAALARGQRTESASAGRTRSTIPPSTPT